MTNDPLACRAAWLAQHVLPHEDMLRRWLLKRPLGGLEIDDVVQDTYAILADLDSVEGIRNPRNYTFQVAHSVVHAHLRRLRIIEFRSIADTDAARLVSDEPSPESAAADKEFLRNVARYLDALPHECRQVLILRRVQRLSHRDIAARLGVAEKSVEKLLFKAAKLLTEMFGRGGNRVGQDSTKQPDEDPEGTPKAHAVDENRGKRSRTGGTSSTSD